jgi:hypothetical protein
LPCVPTRFRRRRSNVPSDEAPPNRLSILPTVETCRVGNEGSPPAACVHRQAADGSALRPRGAVDPPDSPDGAESRCCALLNDELPTASAEGLHRQRAPGHPLLFVTRLLRGRGKRVSTSLLTIVGRLPSVSTDDRLTLAPTSVAEVSRGPRQGTTCPRPKNRVPESDCVRVGGTSSELGSSRFRGDILVQRGREAVGHGHRNKEGPRRARSA